MPPTTPPPPPPAPRRAVAGFTLLELLVVLAITGIAAAIVAPQLLRASTATRVELASGEIVGALRLARSEAIRRHLNVAVRFAEEPGGWSFTLYRDGDGDGVRNRDIDDGIDPRTGPPTTLAHLGRHVRFGFPPGLRPRDPANPRKRLDRLDDPIRFNSSDLASFNPLGASTPGSVYLTDGGRTLHSVRVLDRTGRIRVLRYDREDERWW